MFDSFFIQILLHLLLGTISIRTDDCEFLKMCKCTNFPLFALIDTDYLSKPRSLTNQDLFCTYSFEHVNETQLTTFEQLKYFSYRFRTLTFANYPSIPSRAFRFVHFDSQTVKQTEKINNRNVIAFVNIERTQSGIFEEINLVDAHQQLLIAFLNSPSLIYAPSALSKLNCYELKFQNTNPIIPIDFFLHTHFIHHLIIDNPSFLGFLPPTSSKFTFQLDKLSIKDIATRHLQGKHFPIVLPSVKELNLENVHVNQAFRSFNDRDLSHCFPHLHRLKIFSRSIQHLTKRMFQSFNQLEYLTVDGITTIENDAFFNLYQLKELNLGKSIRRIDPLAFRQMNTDLLVFNQSGEFQINDEKEFCSFAQFNPLSQVKTFVKFPRNLQTCSCTLRYLYRHLDKSFLSMTPYCYSNSSLYVLGQEERLCYFEERLLQCDLLPNDGIDIYGKHYNSSYFYQRQLFKRRNQWAFLMRYRFYFLLALPVLIILLGAFVCIKRQHHRSTYRHLNRLLKRSNNQTTNNGRMDMIYHRTNAHEDFRTSTIPISTKV